MDAVDLGSSMRSAICCRVRAVLLGEKLSKTARNR
jgi:hypothetical protein